MKRKSYVAIHSNELCCAKGKISGQSYLKMYSNIGHSFHETVPLMHVSCLSDRIAGHFPGQFCEFNSEISGQTSLKMYSNIGHSFYETVPLMHVSRLSGRIAVHFPGQFCEFNSELGCAKGKISGQSFLKTYSNLGYYFHETVLLMHVLCFIRLHCIFLDSSVNSIANYVVLKGKSADNPL